jgi:hypothetical protein
VASTDIVTAAREFPITSRVDVRTALEEVVANRDGGKLLGIHLADEPGDADDGAPAHAWTISGLIARERSHMHGPGEEVLG